MFKWIDSRLPEWARQMIRKPEWQKSSALSAISWVLGTFTVVKLVDRLGFGWEINMVVALCLDWPMYLISKRWVWRNRDVTYSQTFCLWGWWGMMSFAMNTVMAILLM